MNKDHWIAALTIALGLAMLALGCVSRAYISKKNELDSTLDIIGAQVIIAQDNLEELRQLIFRKEAFAVKKICSLLEICDCNGIEICVDQHGLYHAAPQPLPEGVTDKTTE